MVKKGLSEILLTAGLITQEQLKECEEQAIATGTTLEACLVEHSYIQQEVLSKSIADFFKVPFIEKITDKMADLEVLAKIPLTFLRENLVLPIRSAEGALFVVVADPFKYQPFDELNMLLGGGLSFGVATPKAILEGINRYYPLEGTKEMMAELEEEGEELSVDLGAIEEKDILTMASEAPIIKLVNHILFQAAKQSASDVHIEPFEKEVRVRYRIDGVMYQTMTPPKRLQGALVSRIKIMANLDIAEKRIPQDGRIDIKVAGRPIDIRVSILPTTFGERIVMRLLDKTRTFVELKNLGFSERDLAMTQESIARPNGIIYVTGPTGSGKTSTLYSVLFELNKPDVNIITVEDPVEYQMQGLAQVQVREKVGLTFAAALRSILRQDPDIIMIGETRDAETAQIAVQSALTGHLVLSTLHTNSAPASITRLLDMGVEPFLIASSVELIMAQRLVRRLCEKCKKAYEPSEELLLSIGLTKKDVEGVTFYEPVGCDECNQLGYRGRLAVFEVMRMSEALAALTMERADTGRINKQARHEGMTTLLEDGIRKIKLGVTTIEEVLSVASIEHEVVE
jgi:general secretion pathway protein E